MSIEAAARKLVSMGSGTSMDFLGYARAYEELSEIVKATPPTIAVAEHPLRRAVRLVLPTLDELARDGAVRGEALAAGLVAARLRKAHDHPAPVHLTDGERRALWKYLNATRLSEAEHELIRSARVKLS